MDDTPPPALGRPAVHPRGLLLASAIGGALNHASGLGGLAAGAAGAIVALVVPPSAGWIVELVLAAALGALTGVIVTLAFLPPRIRRAFESFAWLGSREAARFRARSGGPVPATPEAMAAWLAVTPPTSFAATARIEILAMLGRTDEARAALAALAPPATDLDEVERAGVEALVGFVETGDRSDARLREVAARLDPTSPDGLEAAVAIAVGEARAGLDRGDPGWADPLLAIRTRLGREARATTVRDFWVRAGAMFAALGFVGAVIVGAAQLLLDALARFTARG